ncbi:transmembrane protein 229B-like [Macrobrachium nipponense]|uniref:transmembrane protein 229B-like n=1 Tax=Macrobrachium nipponense TaxID=159736 RepID=UPI0030C8B2A4
MTTTSIMPSYTTLPEPELNVWLRLYIYGIHGFLIEIFFTAAWEFALHQDWALTGCTSVWSLFIYGVGTLVGEKFYRRFHATVPLLIRGLVYVAWIYLWEYTTGRILRMYDACPWDYTERRYNVHGLITLEYFPAWYTASILTEQLIIHNVLFLSLCPQDSHNRLNQKG